MFSTFVKILDYLELFILVWTFVYIREKYIKLKLPGFFIMVMFVKVSLSIHKK